MCSRVCRGVEIGDEMIRPESQRVVTLAGRVGEDRRLGSERVRELDAHVPEPSETDDPDALPRRRSPVAQRRVEGDSGAEQRRHAGEVEAVGHVHRVGLVHDELLGVAAVGDGLAVALERVVGTGRIGRAVLLVADDAVVAGPARVDEGAHPDSLADAELLRRGTSCRHHPDDLVARHHREDRRAPVLVDLVDVRVAHPAEAHVEGDVVRAEFAALEVEGDEGFLGAERRVAGGLHDVPLHSALFGDVVDSIRASPTNGQGTVGRRPLRSRAANTPETAL